MADSTKSSDKTNNITFVSEGSKNDGNISITFSSDNMSVYADFFPPWKDGQPLTLDSVMFFLSQHNVKQGVDNEKIAQEIFELNTERKIKRNVKIAEGIKPINGCIEHIVIFDKYKPGFRPAEDDEKNIDWKSRGQVITVQKGEKIGLAIPANSGTDGCDVTGLIIQAKKDNVETFILGSNIETIENDVVAASDGKISIVGNKISIDQVFVINGDVDYKTGHVMFPGDVVINGTISSGFKVYAGGNISVRETFEAFEIVTKKDLICLQGILGRDEGKIRVGGSLKAKFIEKASLAVRTNIEVFGSIVGSKIYCLGKINMGDKGRIIGGETYAINGLSTAIIGGKTNPLTLIEVGKDFTVEQKIKEANEKLHEIIIKLERLKIIEESRANDEKVIALKSKLIAQRQYFIKGIETLTARININKNATVEVKNIAYPGVVITICSSKLELKKEYKKGIFMLEKGTEKIIFKQI